MWSIPALLLVMAVYQSFCFAKTIPGPMERYGIVVDAGSSGTRIKVYKYFIGRHSPLTPSDVEQVEVLKPDKAKPGLSAYGKKVQMIHSYLKQLIDNAKIIIPINLQSLTPIMLFATAGMRLLPDNQKKAILTEVERLFSNKTFCPFKYHSGDARIITGEQEAMYGWITLNFLKGKFSLNDTKSTLGALDLGGASTQNAYRVSNNGQGQPTLTVQLAGKMYPLYVNSYLGYGLSEATASYFKYIAMNAKGSSLTSPCHNQGYNKLLTILNRQIRIIGAYNEIQCHDVLKNSFFCNRSTAECPFVNQPRIGGTFFGINAFYYVMKDVGVIQSHGQIASFSKFNLLSHQLCSLNSANLNTNLYNVQNLCLRANYLYEMFKDGYHIDFKTFVLHIAKKMSNFDLSWALGALLFNTKIL